jgi:hypothetical protein
MSNATNNQQNTLAKARPPPPALDPERPMLVQPWREFEGRGWLEVQYLGGAITRTVRCKLLAAALVTGLTGDVEGNFYVGPQEAKDRIVQAGLWSPRQKGAKAGLAKKNNVPELPKKSLCKEDFKGNDEALESRARSVANNLGDRTAAGRIGSMALARSGADTFQTWWKGAKGNDIARLLSDKKHYDSFEKADKIRLAAVLKDCPFRPNEPVPSPAEKEDEEPARSEIVVPVARSKDKAQEGEKVKKSKKPSN